MEVGWRRSYFAIFLAAAILALIAVYPRVALVVMSYSYVLFGLVFWGIGRIHRRHHVAPEFRTATVDSARDRQA